MAGAWEITLTDVQCDPELPYTPTGCPKVAPVPRSACELELENESCVFDSAQRGCQSVFVCDCRTHDAGDPCIWIDQPDRCADAGSDANGDGG